MLKSQRLAMLPIDGYDLEGELAIVDAVEPSREYDAFTFGDWTSHVLANGSGLDTDTAFRPHHDGLHLTELGRRLPKIMEFVRTHFRTDTLQWVRIFGLRDGLLAPHVDFLEFEEPGTRLQVPLRTTTGSLHSENDIVYHLRRGEVWRIHATEPHSVYSGPGPARLALCLDFAGTGFDPVDMVTGTVPTSGEVHLVDRPPLDEDELQTLITALTEAATEPREMFRRLAAWHFTRRSHAVEVFDWFVAAAQRRGDPVLADKARAFRRFCVERRAYKEDFSW